MRRRTLRRLLKRPLFSQSRLRHPEQPHERRLHDFQTVRGEAVFVCDDGRWDAGGGEEEGQY